MINLKYGVKVKKKKKQPEAQVARSLWMWFCLQYPNHRNRYLRIESSQGISKTAQTRLKREGMQPGISDVFIAVPTDNYGGLWLELKADKGKLSDNQERFQQELEPDYWCKTGFGLEQCKEIITRHMLSAGIQGRHLQL